MKITEQGVKEQSNPQEVVRATSVRPNWLVRLVASGASLLALSSCTAVVEGHASSNHDAVSAAGPLERRGAPIFRDVCSLDETMEDHQRMASTLLTPANELTMCMPQDDGTIGGIKSIGTWYQGNGTKYVVYIQDDTFKEGQSAFKEFNELEDVTPSPMTTSDHITLPCPWRYGPRSGKVLTTIDGYNVGVYAQFPNEAASTISGPGLLQNLALYATEELYVRNR